MDVHHMTYDDESFDVILDKGTLDAIICGDESSSNPEQALLEVNRVLKKFSTNLKYCSVVGIL